MSIWSELIDQRARERTAELIKLEAENKSANETLQKISGCLCYGCRAGKAVDLIKTHFLKFTPTLKDKETN